MRRSSEAKKMEELQAILDVRDVPAPIRKLKSRKRHVIVHSPIEELRHLIKQHKALVRTKVATEAMARVRLNAETGKDETALPADARATLLQTAKWMEKRASGMESALKQVLREIPIYQTFLKDVFGCGTIISAYLVAEIDIVRSVKPSGLRRFCGLAVYDGHLERRAKGVESQYSSEMRTRIFQLFNLGILRCAKKTQAGRPFGTMSKYLEIWLNYKHRMENSPRYDAASNTLAPLDGGPPRKGARSFILATGWHKAADVFLEDLYIVWRTIEGLPVWPSYHAAKLGYAHGGKVCVNAPRMLTIEEALETVAGYKGVAAEEPFSLAANETKDEV